MKVAPSHAGLRHFIASFIFIAAVQLTASAKDGCIDVIQVQSPALQGNLLGDSATRSVSVYLPGEYESEEEKRYPVVYLLHGYGAKDTFWTGDGFVKGLNIAEIADKLIESDQIEPMIVVAPNCYNEYLGSWYTNSPVTGNWEDFIADDLIRQIDEMYRTIPKVESRAIAGHSMGGHGAIKLAMKHPEKFCALYAMSPAWIVFSEMMEEPFAGKIKEAVSAKDRNSFDNLHWRAQAFIALAAAVAPNPGAEPFHVDFPIDDTGNRDEDVWQRWLQSDLATTMLAKHGDNLRKFKSIAIDCGTQEDLLPMNIVFSEALTKAGIDHSFEKFEGDHLNRVSSQLETRVFPFFSRTLDFEPAAALVAP